AVLTHEVLAERDAAVIGIDNLQLARIARLAGAPKVQGAGVDLLCKLGQSVRAGDVLYRVYADFPADLAFARQACERLSGFTIGLPEQASSGFVDFCRTASCGIAPTSAPPPSVWRRPAPCPAPRSSATVFPTASCACACRCRASACRRSWCS